MAKKDGSSESELSLEARVENIETALARLDGLVTAELSGVRELLSEALGEIRALSGPRTKQ